MTREDLFRAIGEARDGQVADADTPAVKRAVRWQRYAALAACLALVLAGTFAVNRLTHTEQDSSGMRPGNDRDGQNQSGTANGELWPGKRLSSDNVSFNMNLDPETLPEAVRQPDSASYDIQWLSDDELLDFDSAFYSGWDVAVFRGTVRDITCNAASWESGGTGVTRYFSVAVVEVTECLRGDLNAGETYSLLLNMVPGYVTTSISHPLDDLAAGSDAVFIAGATTPDIGVPMGDDGFFCYADAAQFWNFEGGRFVFLDNGDGPEYWEDAWAGLAASAPAGMDDVTAYLRSRLSAAGQGGAGEPVPHGTTEEPESVTSAYAPGEGSSAPADGAAG